MFIFITCNTQLGGKSQNDTFFVNSFQVMINNFNQLLFIFIDSCIVDNTNIVGNDIREITIGSIYDCQYYCQQEPACNFYAIRKPGVNFIMFTSSFYARKSQKRKKLLELTVFVVLLGSARVKVVHTMLVKLTPDANNGIPRCLLKLYNGISNSGYDSNFMTGTKNCNKFTSKFIVQNSEALYI